VKGWFVTGTDTDCGKTLVAAAMVDRLRHAGQRVAVMKPVASGCEMTPDGLRNADAETLIAAAGMDQPYKLINPYAFAPPIAPHIAAARAGVTVDMAHIVTAADLLMHERDLLVVEGAGGWRVPLGDGQAISDLARALQMPVILVVGIRLGCINHALLTVEAIEQDGCQLDGWVANVIAPDVLEQGAVLQTLRGSIAAPCLGVVPYLAEADAALAASYLSLPLGK
jgi:dethiobiotin synthetase